MLEYRFEVPIDEYEKFTNKSKKVHNEILRDEGQTFADAMCEGSIVEGLDIEVGEKIIEIIKNAGKRNND
jgi:hypothetical protein